MPDQPPLGASPDPQQPPSWMEALPLPLRTLLALPRELPEADTFAIVVLSPVPFMVLAALFGGLAAWIAFLWIAVFIFLLDELLARPAPDAPEGSEFPAADTLSQVLAGVHFALLFLAVWALSGGTYLGFGSKVLVFLSFGLFFGQVSNSNAHELIHRSDKRLFLLGKWIYTSLLFGHHTSAHRHVHHRFAATPNDPNSAELGEGFWSFAPRAWIGSFRTGFEMEKNLRQRTQGSIWRPYADYILGGAGFALVVAVLFGAGGLLAYLLLCLYAQIQLLLSDYVQHYGLSRKALGNGQYEPVNEAHSWDAPHPVSSLWMLNAPRHSDHHAHPSRVYPALRLGDTGAPGRPILPRSLPAMAAVALVPPLWRRVMDHRVRALAKASR